MAVSRQAIIENGEAENKKVNRTNVTELERPPEKKCTFDQPRSQYYMYELQVGSQQPKVKSARTPSPRKELKGAATLVDTNSVLTAVGQWRCHSQHSAPLFMEKVTVEFSYKTRLVDRDDQA